MEKIGIFKRIAGKPLSVLFFRVRQESVLFVKEKLSFWQALSAKLEKQYSSSQNTKCKPVLLYPGSIVLNKAQARKLCDTAHNVLYSRFEIFGHTIPDLQSSNFSEDWRYGKSWPKQYFKKYSFYEKKNLAYDVKFPWELSRFFYLVPVLACQWAICSDDKALHQVLSFLQRWRKENPLAYSVNWYPMEASMRIISLVLLHDFTCLLLGREKSVSHCLVDLEKILRIMLVEHGEFVWATREYTDLRGNHFTANIVALLMVSCSLGGENNIFRHWFKYAVKWLDKEISLQFCRDGVNFEKSCGYHKLVLELFLLAAIARERSGVPFSQEKLSILNKAALFSDAIMRPDGKAANFGDTDDAVGLPFLLDDPRNHAPVIELARTFLNRNIGTGGYRDEDRMAAVFLLGCARIQAPLLPKKECVAFPDGGYVIVRNKRLGFFLMADIGEVGMSGRGGHGHNDLLSFELCIDGQRIVIDPGSPCYTADLEKKEFYRRTENHATVEIYGKEMASFSGYWGIRDDARPLDAKVTEHDDVVTIHAGHSGYERCAAGTRIWRTFRVNSIRQQLIVIDRVVISREKGGNVSWNFPLDPNVSVIINSDTELCLLNQCASVFVQSEVPLEITPCFVSPGYGQECKSMKLISKRWLARGEHQFVFHFTSSQDCKR